MIINGSTIIGRNCRSVIAVSITLFMTACNTMLSQASLQKEEMPGHLNSTRLAVVQPAKINAQGYFDAAAPDSFNPYLELSVARPAYMKAAPEEIAAAAVDSYESVTDVDSIETALQTLVPTLDLKMSQSSEAFSTLQQEASEAVQIQANAWYRLQQGMSLPEVDNKRITAQLNWYLNHRSYLQRVIQRAEPILPFVLDELEKKNLPVELALLPVVESAYQTFAYSHGRASGLWQIIPSTGRFLGLKQSWWYDGRRDIIESTHAAIRYLDGLAKQFNGDWELALASYNAGPGKIRSAIRYNRKKNRQTDFWSLTRLRKETKDYVPKLYALKEIFGNPELYDLDIQPVSNELSYEIV